MRVIMMMVITTTKMKLLDLDKNVLYFTLFFYRIVLLVQIIKLIFVMAFNLEQVNEIFKDDSLLFSDEEMSVYPNEKQIANYKTSHRHYNGKYIEIWTLYFEIIEHLMQRKFSGGHLDEELMKDTMKKNYWIANEKHDVRFISLMFAILNKKITTLLEKNSTPTNNEWNMLLNYTSAYLPMQVHNMLNDKEKSLLFGKYSLRNSPVSGKEMIIDMLESTKAK